jgi:hypothetical protein
MLRDAVGHRLEQYPEDDHLVGIEDAVWAQLGYKFLFKKKRFWNPQAVSTVVGASRSFLMFSGLLKDPLAADAQARMSHVRQGVSLNLGAIAFALSVSVLPNALAESRSAQVAPNITTLSKDDGHVGDATDIALGPRGEDVRLSGQIVEGAADRLDSLLTQHPGVKRIHLTSEGGLAYEGAKLGDVIARHRLATYVPDYCMSACTLVFVRGVERLLLRGARLGFHAPYEIGSSGDIAVDSSGERAEYIAAGVDTAFVDAALKIASSDIWIPEPEILIHARVATASVGPDRFPDSNLDGADDEAGARETILRNFPSLLSPDTTSTAILGQAVAWYLSAYNRGESEQTVQVGLQRYAALSKAQTRALRVDASRRPALRIQEADVTNVSVR